MPEPRTFYHGSSTPLPVDAILKGRGDAYEADWSGTDFYAILEAYRPAHCLAHKDAVFMVGSPDDIDPAGGATDWCAEVTPLGAVARHDLNWCTQISCLVSVGHAATSEAVRAAAQAYWAGLPHGDEDACVWEYLASAMRCEPYESFEEIPIPS